MSENYSSGKLGSKGNPMEHCHLLVTQMVKLQKFTAAFLDENV